MMPFSFLNSECTLLKRRIVFYGLSRMVMSSCVN